jgi:hypothetical protein
MLSHTGVPTLTGIGLGMSLSPVAGLATRSTSMTIDTSRDEVYDDEGSSVASSPSFGGSDPGDYSDNSTSSIGSMQGQWPSCTKRSARGSAERHVFCWW